MRKRLLKDVVIPAGTIMEKAPVKTQRNGDCHVQCVVGLTDDTSGAFEYCLEVNDPAVDEWFEDVVD